jgi:hypothetical protein
LAESKTFRDPDRFRPTISDLRWPVSICKRVQSADPASSGIVESYISLLDVRANIQPSRTDTQPVGPLTYYAGEQVEGPFTHQVMIRWLDWVDTTHVIQRQTRRLDGTVRTELFRIRRAMEVNGRKRFLFLMCEQEKRS